MARRTLVRNFSVGVHGLMKRAAIQPLQCVTVDVTGTLMGYKGVLGDYYCMAAKAAGLPCPDYDRMHQGFKVAYKEMDTKYPCFGKLHEISNTVWWQMVVRNSFREVCCALDTILGLGALFRVQSLSITIFLAIFILFSP